MNKSKLYTILLAILQELRPLNKKQQKKVQVGAITLLLYERNQLSQLGSHYSA